VQHEQGPGKGPPGQVLQRDSKYRRRRLVDFARRTPLARKQRKLPLKTTLTALGRQCYHPAPDRLTLGSKERA
jgi:hypothetical protein